MMHIIIKRNLFCDFFIVFYISFICILFIQLSYNFKNILSLLRLTEKVLLVSSAIVVGHKFPL